MDGASGSTSAGSVTSSDARGRSATSTDDPSSSPASWAGWVMHRRGRPVGNLELLPAGQRRATTPNREEADKEERQQNDGAGDDPEGRLIHRLILKSNRPPPDQPRPSACRAQRWRRRLDQLDEARGRLTVAVEVLSGARDPPGDLRSAPLAAPFDADEHEADDAGGDEEDGDHGDEDGRHERCLSDSHRGRNCLAALRVGRSYRRNSSSPILSARSPAPGSPDVSGAFDSVTFAPHATDSISRSLWEITAETPSPRIVTP